jgi:DNA processing protein
MKINQVTYGTAEYPEGLTQLKHPPKHLYVLGELPSQPMVAIVGTRKNSPYGDTHAHQFAKELAQAGVVIVSGLATGIDSIAHRAALQAGGKTVAVLAGGLNNIYPAHHRNLAKEILATGGALISEQPVGEPSQPGYFVARNRIIAGLSRAVIIVEAPVKSGALHTAKFAAQVGAHIMVPPADIGRESAAGSNNLLRDGAIPITSAPDVLNLLGLAIPINPEIQRANNAYERKVLKLLRAGNNSTEQLIQGTGLSPGEFASLISLMEITGQIRNLGGSMWAKR